MRTEFIIPNAEMITEHDPLKKIERCGRNCYKSVSALTSETARAFYQMLLEKKHHAMLEHATFVFELQGEDAASDDTALTIYKQGCGYIKYTCTPFKFSNKFRVLVSGNLRAIIESGIYFLNRALCDKYPALFESLCVPPTAKRGVTAEVVELSEYSNLTEAEIDAHYWSTFLITTDRGVTHEIVRHRPVSYAMESTRYVNYSKPKPAVGMTVIPNRAEGLMRFIIPADFDKWTPQAREEFKAFCEYGAEKYEYLTTKCGCTAQQARGILPHAIKADIIMTTNAEEWKHFFDLRYFGATGAPHPNMEEVAEIIYKKWKDDYELLCYKA